MSKRTEFGDVVQVQNDGGSNRLKEVVISHHFKKVSAEFLIITQSNAECSYWVKQEEGAEHEEIHGDWYPEECQLPTSHVYVMIEADGVNLYSLILTGDDWRYLEVSGLLQPFTDEILSGAEPHAVLSGLRVLKDNAKNVVSRTLEQSPTTAVNK